VLLRALRCKKSDRARRILKICPVADRRSDVSDAICLGGQALSRWQRPIVEEQRRNL